MSTAPVINPYEISMDELARLANTAPAEPVGTIPTVEQPRDANGRFVTTSAPAVDPSAPVVDPAAPVVDPAAPVEEYTATIDIGDGAGTQVFSAPTKDELLTKLIEAQENATRKIRELSAAKVTPVAPVAPADPDPDAELALSQRLLSEPTKALDEYYEKRRAEERKQEQEIKDRASAVDSLAREWMAATPDYYVTQANGLKMVKWLELHRKEETKENFQAAYEDLNASGLLAVKPAAAAPVVPAAPTAPAPRSSGISTRHSAAPPATPAEDINKLSKEQLLARAGGYQY